MARPSLKPPKLKDGFYIELSGGSHGRGIKIHRETKKEIDHLMEQYQRMRDVTYLGEMKEGKFLDEKGNPKKKKKR